MGDLPWRVNASLRSHDLNELVLGFWPDARSRLAPKGLLIRAADDV